MTATLPTDPATLPYNVHKIARTFGTPTWVYDAATIEKRVREVQAFDTVRYAQKANSNLAVLALMRSLGVKVDAVTAGELFRAQQAGYDLGSDDVVFTADLFDDDAIEWIELYKIPVNLGSADMLDRLSERGLTGENQVPITLRLNPGFGHGHSQKVNTGGESSKHGIWHTHLAEVLAHATELNLKVHGLHMHIGSGADFEHLSQVAAAMQQAADTFVQANHRLEVISAGGGLPIPYRKDNSQRIDLDRYYQVWDDARQAIAQQAGHDITLEVEPGRYLVAEAGSLVTTVRSIKTTGDRHYTLIDAGFSDLVRPAFYGAYHHISIHPKPEDDKQAMKINDSSDSAANLRAVTVAGPLCESCDVFTQDDDGFVTTRDLPPTQVGDLLVLHDAGAYGFAMSSNYNSRRLAAEVMLHDGKTQLIRQRQPFEALTDLETIPTTLTHK
jgi:diaminopimelate decarboxylase